VIISAESLLDLNAVPNTMAVTFNLRWNYSWRLASGPSNWDAVWVFVKYRRNGGAWAHASLMDTGHTAPAGATLTPALRTSGTAFNIATNPAVGAFVYKNAPGFGPNNFTGVKLLWNYVQDGVAQGDSVAFQIHAVHMVYVPPGAFYAGDNNASTSSYRQGSSDNDPWYISGEGAITTANIPGTGTGVGGTNAEYYDAAGFTIPAGFPKGHAAFYMMRHEITQEQWLYFFNTLPSGTPRNNRDVTSSTGKNSDSVVNGNNVRWLDTGDATLPEPLSRKYCTHPANYLSWADLAAWLDWAGLRPMTELEYEKAARGPLTAVAGEYAWGTNTGTHATGVTNLGVITEVPNTPGTANNVVWGNNYARPVRVGSFASNNYGITSRVNSGGSYYGVLELSGNVRERAITTHNSGGRNFTGIHGDGAVDSNGEANVTNWPSSSTADGVGFRGGSYSDLSDRARVSDRLDAANTLAGRAAAYGGRGVRTAP
jgi:formylglycine-generating enzyme required for sulfatase activity